MTIRPAASFLAAFAVFASVPLRASATPSARLLYVRNAGTESCPDEAEFRKAVAARLGYDPFFPWAKTTVLATLDRDGTGFHGIIEVLDEHSNVLGRRVLTTPSGECVEIARTMGLAVSVALDDLDLGAAAPPPADPRPTPPAAPVPPSEPQTPAVEPAPPPAPPRPPPVERSPAPSRKPVTPIVFSLTAGPIATLGLAPAPSVGAELAVRARRGPFSLEFAGRADLPSSGAYLGSTVSAYAVAGELLPCFHPTSWLYACAVGLLGTYAEHGSLASTGHDSTLLAALGLRAGVELPLGRRFFLDGHVDGLVPLTAIDVTVGTETDPPSVFSVTPVIGTAGVAAGVRF